MRLVLFILLAYLPCTAFSVSNASDTPLRELNELRWQNRVLLIWSEPSVIKELKRMKGEINDRDLIWFLVTDKSVTSNYEGNISEQLITELATQFKKSHSRVVLIGKDGGIKNQYSSLDLNAVFSAIDAMPMRQYEMRNG